MNRREFTMCGVGMGLNLLALQGLRAQAPAQEISSPSPQAAIDRFALVDPELLPAVKDSQLSPLTYEIVLNARKQGAAIEATFPSIPGVHISKRTIPGATGAPDVPIVIADTAPDRKNKPVLFHIHGGGYVLGAAEIFLPGVLRYAIPTGCVVVSVNYRLAPETRFPGALQDNYAALQWVYHHAEDLGIDRKRIAIAGESAGGGHAAALAIHARDRGEVPVLFQLLIYPMLDDRTGSTRAVPPPIGQIAWGADGNRYGWTSLLGTPAGSAKVPYGSVPARVETLAGLPPAFIGVGAIDLFVDEDVEYARRLIAAAVPTELHVVPGAYHAFDLSVPGAQVSKRFTQSITVALQRAFTNPA